MTKLRTKDEDGLTVSDRRLADEYLVDLNITAAAKRALNLPHEQAKRAGWKVLQKPAVQVYIQRRTAERAERTQISQDDVLRELAQLGFANMGDFVRVTDDGALSFDFSELTREKASAISEVIVEETLEADQSDPEGKRKRTVRRTRFKLHDKKGALESLAKHLGLYANKQAPPPKPKDQDLAEMTDEQIDAEFDRLLGEVGARTKAPKAAAGKKGKGPAGAGRPVRNVRPN